MNSNTFIDTFLEEARKAGTDICPVHSVLITQEGCPSCADMSGRLSDLVKSGSIRSIAEESDEAARLMIEADVDMVPQLFNVDCDGHVVKQANLDELFGGPLEEVPPPEETLDPPADTLEESPDTLEEPPDTLDQEPVPQGTEGGDLEVMKQQIVANVKKLASGRV